VGLCYGPGIEYPGQSSEVVRVSIKWNHDGFEGILTCEGASSICQQEAARIMASAASAGGAYSMHQEYVVRFSNKRVAWYVKADDDEAVRKCAEDKVLERAI
jgi:hypothetical protein